jgi:hypothetical protein
MNEGEMYMQRLAAVSLLAVALMQNASGAQARQPVDSNEDAARPTDSTANLPSAVGAQTTTPVRAVTGAGHAQPQQIKELEYGRPGGLQQRAREREQSTGAAGESVR